MQNIPLHLMNTFLAFAGAKNISDAANALGITQPAVTKHLQQFESLLPIPVFTQMGRKKALTPFGQELAKNIGQRIGNLSALIEATCTRHLSPQYASLRISARRGILDRISTIEFSGCLSFLETGNEVALGALLDSTTDIAIIHSLPNSFEVKSRPLFQEKFQLVIPKTLLPKKHTLGKELLYLLSNIPCLGFKPEDEIVKKLYLSYQIDSKLKIIRTTENYSTLLHWTQKGMGWAILPCYLDPSAKENWLIPIPMKNSRLFYLAYRGEYSEIPWFRDFLAEIQKCFG